MAVEATNNVIFGADFDNSNFKKNVLEMVESLKQGSTVQKELQGQFDKTSLKLQETQTELKELQGQLNNTGKTTKQFAGDTDGLKKKIIELRIESQNLKDKFSQQEQELDKLKSKNIDLNKTLEQVNTTQKKVQETFGKKITPNVDIGSLNTAATKLEQLKANFKNTFSSNVAQHILDPNALNELRAIFDGAESEFKGFAGMVEVLTQALVNTEPGTEEFKLLSDTVKAGKQVLNEYQKAYQEATNEVQKSEPKYKSIRARLAELRNEMTKLEEQGLEESKAFKKIQLEAARLTDQYGDMQQQIRILASDTKYLDFGLSSIQAVGAGFQVVTGALTLFGMSSEDAEKTQAKLLAIMNLVQGAQQLQNLLLKESVIRTVGADIAAKGYALSQRILAATLGATAAASRAANAALITTGVGALIVALGYLISKLVEWSETTNDAADAQARLNNEVERGAKNFNFELDVIEFNGKKREEKLKQQGLSDASIYANNQQILQDKIVATRKRLQQTEFDLVKDASLNEGKNQQKINEERSKLSESLVTLQMEIELNGEKERTRIAEEGRKKRKDNQKKDNTEAIDLLSQIRFELAQRSRTEEEKEIAELDREYLRKLSKLKKFHLSTEELERLHAGQVADIRSKYSVARAEEERKIIDDLEKISLQGQEARLNNIQDEFEKERATIKLENQKSKAELQQQQTDLLNGLLSDKNAKLITPAKYEETVAEVNRVFDGLFGDLEDKTRARFIELGSSILQGTIQGMNEALEIGNNNRSANAKAAMKQEADLYVAGKITFEEYQKKLTEIQKLEDRERLESTRKTIAAQIKLLEQRLLSDKIPDKERKALELQLSGLKKAYEDSDQQLSEQDAENKKKGKDKNNEYLNAIIAQYSAFVSVVGGFLSELNRAEQQRLDRSIAIQERRVANAKDIAEKGNAEYLELEQKRLDELNRKREENARKQLAIDNAIRVSQATVAAVSAIAQASVTGNPFAAIGAGIAVLAAIAAAYQFVSALQAPSAEFFEGTTFVDGEPGRDKVRAKLTRGEAVIPVDRNQDYHESVKAIYNRSVPAEVLNNFVANYPTAAIPSIDFSRLGLATDRNLTRGDNSEITQRLDRVNATMNLVAEKLGNLDNVSLNLDENGFALSIVRVMNSEKLKWFN